MRQSRRFVLLTIFTLAIPVRADQAPSTPLKLADPKDSQPKLQTSAKSDPDKKYECTADSVATKFKVPNEPDVALPIITAIVTRKNYAPLNAESRLLRLVFDNDKDPKILCLEWDILKKDGIVDFTTCRRARLEGAKMHMDEYPVSYLVDLRKNKKGHPKDNMDMFLDADHDGDICDPEFTHLGKLKDLNVPSPPP